nr:hypothetical protein [Tanacetum cinerariifolium]
MDMMKPKYTRSTVHAYTENRTKRIQAIIVRELLILAEEGVNIARDQHTYTDQTGNLTASIGYELYVNGSSYSSDFQPSARGSESGEEGMAKGRALSAEIGPNGNVVRTDERISGFDEDVTVSVLSLTTDDLQRAIVNVTIWIKDIS